MSMMPRYLLILALTMLTSACAPDLGKLSFGNPNPTNNTNDNDTNDDLHWDPPFLCASRQQEVSTYAYDDAGTIREIKRRRMNNDLDTSTFEEGHIVRRTIGRAGEALVVEADWQYNGELLTRVDVVDKRYGYGEDEAMKWSITFTHDEAGRVSEAQGEGIFTDALIHGFFNQLNGLLYFSEDMEIADGVNLHWSHEIATQLLFADPEPTRFSVRYTYDAEGHLARAEWDMNGDTQPDFISEEVRTTLSHITYHYNASTDAPPYSAFDRTFDEQGNLVSLLNRRGDELTTSETWTWKDLPDGNACSTVREVKRTREYNSTNQPKEVLVKTYDTQDRLVFDAVLNDRGQAVDRTFTSYLTDGRLEERDRDANGSIDQTTRYTYDADGRLLSVFIEEDSTYPEPCESFGLWRFDATCTQ